MQHTRSKPGACRCRRRWPCRFRRASASPRGRRRELHHLHRARRPRALPRQERWPRLHQAGRARPRHRGRSRGLNLRTRPRSSAGQHPALRSARPPSIPHLMPEPGHLPLGIGARIGLATRDRLRQRQIAVEMGDQPRHAMGAHHRQSGSTGARAGARPRPARLRPSSPRSAGRFRAGGSLRSGATKRRSNGRPSTDQAGGRPGNSPANAPSPPAPPAPAWSASGRSAATAPPWLDRAPGAHHARQPSPAPRRGRGTQPARPPEPAESPKKPSVNALK